MHLHPLDRLPNGLYGDNRTDAGGLDPTVYSYNQGTPIGLDVAVRRNGEQRYVDRAKLTTAAAPALSQLYALRAAPAAGPVLPARS